MDQNLERDMNRKWPTYDEYGDELYPLTTSAKAKRKMSPKKLYKMASAKKKPKQMARTGSTVKIDFR
jgi:hypothetical protein